MQDPLQILKSLEGSGILLDGITDSGFLSMLQGNLGASLLGDLLTENLSGRGVTRAGELTIRPVYG